MLELMKVDGITFWGEEDEGGLVSARRNEVVKYILSLIEKVDKIIYDKLSPDQLPKKNENHNQAATYNSQTAPVHHQSASNQQQQYVYNKEDLINKKEDLTNKKQDLTNNKEDLNDSPVTFAMSKLDSLESSINAKFGPQIDEFEVAGKDFILVFF